jgi:tRNA threonylcarbamoyladenosine biosynthesis protein TsaB
VQILAIDTATQVCGVALNDGGHLVAEFRLHQRNVHNERLVTAVERLLADAGWRLPELQGIAVSIGPGSFTGLRIGVTVAKGLAYSLDIPLTGVNTLDVLAHGAGLTERVISVVIKARQGEMYHACYHRRAGQLTRDSEYRILTTAELASHLRDSVVICDPHGLVNEADSWQLAAEAYCHSRPSVLAALGHAQLMAGQHVAVDLAEPFYLKDFAPKKKKILQESQRAL